MKKKIVMVGGALLLLIIIVSSVSKNSEVKKSFEEGKKQAGENLEKPAVTYILSANAKTIGASEVGVSGETNLPEGSVLEITGVRLFTFEGEKSERYSYPEGGYATLSVKNGKYQGSIKLDDKKFLDFWINSSEPVRLSPDINISVVFTPKENQTDEILKIVGTNGEHFANSPNKEVIGSATDHPYNTLEVEMEIPLSFPYPKP